MEKRYFPNLGYLQDKLPQEIVNSLIDCVTVDFTEEDDKRHTLAGHLRYEYGLLSARPFLEPYICHMCMAYVDAFDYDFRGVVSAYKKYHDADTTRDEQGALDSEGLLVSVTKSLVLDDIWVNFQQKHEFNPVHTHSGLFSFVIWLNIPYEDEVENGPDALGASGIKANGNFVFHYTDTLGRVHGFNIPADKSYNGTIILFPSMLSHSVNPFYSSDGKRITISGNVYLL